MKSNILSGLVILISLFFYAFSVQAQEKPEIFVQMGHSGSVNSVTFSPDGKYIASGSEDKTIKLWDVETGREIRTLRGNSYVSSIAFSPDGRLLVSGGFENVIRLWDIEKGKEVRAFSIGKKEASKELSSLSVAFSPDGRLIAAACGEYDEAKNVNHSVIKLFDVKTGRILKIIKGHTDTISSVSFSPDGRYLASGSGWLTDDSKDNTVRVWDIKTGSEIKRFSGHTNGIMSVAFSPNGRYVASGSNDKTVKIWDISKGNEPRTFKTSDKVFTIAFSPDGKRLISSGRMVMELWDVSSGQVIATFKNDTTSVGVGMLTFSPDGRYVAVFFSGDLSIWDISTVAHGAVYHISQNAAEFIGKLKTFGGNVEGANIVYFSASGEKIIAVSHILLREFDRFAGTLRGRKEIGRQYDDKRFFEVADYSQGPISVIDGKENGAIIRTGYDVSKYKEIPYFQTFSPDGRYGIGRETEGGSCFAYKIIDIRSKKEVSILENPSCDLIRMAVFSPDGKYMAGSFTNFNNPDTLLIRLWDIHTGKQIRTFSGHSHYISALAFTPDGKILLSGSMDHTVKLWNVSTGKEIKTFKGHSSVVEAVVVSTNGELALTGSWDNTLKLWDVSTGKEIRTFKGHTNSVRSVSFSPDEKYILSASGDGTTRLWDISTGKEIAQFISFTDGEWVVITPEGHYNSSANGDKHLNVRIGNNVYGIENYREAFYRPDLVKLALSGGSLKGFKTLADVKQPPVLTIVDTPKNTDKNEIAITIKITDTGGGVGDIRLYLNGSAVVLDSARGVKITPKDDKTVYKTYALKLSNGLNTIRAIAFNGDNTMQSNDVLYEITASFKSLTKPSLNAVIVGINEYKNPKLQLKYAVSDAELFEDTLKKVTAGLFEKVNIKKLVTKENTTSENIIKELKSYKTLNPDDVFVFFVASHGTVDDGEYFLITSNVGSTRTEKLKTDALTQGMLKELIANIPATKKLIIIDTCSAGALGEAIQVAMLTRGMSEDTAMKILSRAVGSTILSASTSLQEAVEGYKGHGLFTYVLVEGLKGKADKGKTGYVKTTELADYVDNEVPALAEKVFKRAQYPTISISGQGFPIGKTVK